MVSNQPGSKIGVPGNAAAGSISMSPSGGAKSGLGGSGGGSSIGRGEGPGSGLSGEGSGAALAVGIVRCAAACHNGMATFAEAGVAGKEG